MKKTIVILSSIFLAALFYGCSTGNNYALIYPGNLHVTYIDSVNHVLQSASITADVDIDGDGGADSFHVVVPYSIAGTERLCAWSESGKTVAIRLVKKETGVSYLDARSAKLKK